jgi:hypothetical protein
MNDINLIKGFSMDFQNKYFLNRFSFLSGSMTKKHDDPLFKAFVTVLMFDSFLKRPDLFSLPKSQLSIFAEGDLFIDTDKKAGLSLPFGDALSKISLLEAMLHSTLTADSQSMYALYFFLLEVEKFLSRNDLLDTSKLQISDDDLLELHGVLALLLNYSVKPFTTYDFNKTMLGFEKHMRIIRDAVLFFYNLAYVIKVTLARQQEYLSNVGCDQALDLLKKGLNCNYIFNKGGDVLLLPFPVTSNSYRPGSSFSVIMNASSLEGGSPYQYYLAMLRNAFLHHIHESEQSYGFLFPSNIGGSSQRKKEV